MLATFEAKAQLADCSCFRTQAVLTATGCFAPVPDMCQYTQCYPTSGQVFTCSQSPPANTLVPAGTHVITITITDPNGQSQQCAVLFTVNQPQTGPFALICAPNKTIQCPPPAGGMFDPPTATNECCNAAGTPPNVTITVVGTTTNGVCPRTYTRTWQAVDDCGHTNTCSQSVTVVDNTPPTINCGQNETVTCGQGWGFTVPIISDNCTAPSDLILTIVSTSTNFTCGQTFNATRIWKVTDLCGNSTLCTQVVTLVDFTAPTITCAPNKTVQCGTQWSFDTPTGTDNCGGPVTIRVLNTTTNGTCPQVITRTWNATDGCGNVSQPCSQSVTVVDTTPPVMSCPNRTVECGQPFGFPQPAAFDACSGVVSIAFLGNVTNGTCPQVITSTWSATDGCGNSNVCSYTTTVVDTKPPTLDCDCLQNPAVVQLTVVACSNAIPDLCAIALGGGCAQDDCGPLTCTQTPAAGTIVFPGTHPITVTVTDCAGNSVSCTVIFTVIAPPDGCDHCPDQVRSWNTGTGQPGQPDPNYTLISAPPGGCTGPAQIVTNAHPLWVPNGPNSQWIGADANAWCQPGVYRYQLCFYLACTDRASIVGQWTSDDGSQMLLNGQPTGHTVPSQQVPNNIHDRWHPVAITNGFICGTNYLDFYVTNANIGINATGLRAELTNIFNECCCTNQTNVYSLFSGTDANGLMPFGSQDGQFTLTCAPPGVSTITPYVVTAYPGWVPDGPNSLWLSPDPNHLAPEGVYCYTVPFTLPPCDGVPTYALTGQWAADNTGAIHLNGQPTGISLTSPFSFQNWSPINITSGLVPGPNTLTFFVTNEGGPTGLRVELTASFSCCECCACDFQNGDFELPVPTNATGNGWTSANNFSGDGWQATGGNPNGTFLLNNVGDPNTDPTISQELCCLRPGQCYTIRGQRKVQAWFQQTAPSFAVLLDGVPILTLPVPSNPADTNWYDFAVSFVATNRCQTIGFASEINGTDVSYWIDNITLECCETNCTVSITCPRDIDREICGTQGQLSYPSPVATSSCGLPVNVVCSPPGFVFPLGTTPVTCTGTDPNGNSASCTFFITLRPDSTPPTIDCACLQSQLVQVTACMAPIPNVCGLTHCFSDNCTPENQIVCQQSPPAGTMVGPGSHLITVTIFDQAGNSNQCTVSFTVNAPLPGTQVWNTGAGLSPGTPDPNFTLVSFPTGGCPGPAQVIHPTSVPNVWVPNSATSQWIGPAQFVSTCPAGVYHYRLRFTVPCATGASITGRWTSDDSARMILNGQSATTHTVPSTGNPTQSYQGWHLVNITGGFVAGVNVLDIYVTNATVYTGFRAELIHRFSCCCPDAITLNCPPRPLRRWVCNSNDVANVPFNVTASSACGTVSVKCVPPSPGPFPVGTTTVTCTATDSLGNQKSCSFHVIVSADSGPPRISCPGNLTFLTCSNGTKAHWFVRVRDDCDPAPSVTCTPPSGSFFLPGVTTVTCTATDGCGNKSTCTFKVTVNAVLSGPPTHVFTGGLPDNFAGAVEPSPQSACAVSAFSGFSFWKGFDRNANNTLLGHRFTGLPNNVVQGQFEIRMRPGNNPGSDNDGLHMGLPPSCAPGSFVFVNAIKTLPGAVPPTGGTWIQPSNWTTTFTFPLTAALINRINTDQFLDAVVHDDTTVDYMRLRLWRCPPRHPGIGIPFEPIGDTTFAVRGATDDPDDLGPAIKLFPDASGQSGVTLEPGTPQAITFFTALSFDAPVDATFELALPGDSGGFASMLTFRKTADNWNLKVNKRMFVSDSGNLRVTAANTNCGFGSFVHHASEPDIEDLVRFAPMNDATSVGLLITVDCDTREMTIEIPHCDWMPDNARKGWDGCIYGPDRPVKKPTSAKLVITPEPPLEPRLRIGTVPFAILARGLSEVTIESPGITSQERKWSDGHVTLMKAYDDEPEARKMEFTTFGEGGGVHVDLGRADTFKVGIHHFENGDLPTEEQLFRIIGPPVLINRPAPPTNHLRLARGPDGVGASVDFSDLGATAIIVQLWSNGVLVAQGRVEGPVISPDAPLVMSRWIEHLGRPAINEGIVLTSTELMHVSCCEGDEVRFLPELPSGSERMPYVSRLQVLTSEGMESTLYELQTTPAGDPVRLNISRSGEMVTLDWTGEGYILQGAENLEGPWVDLCEPVDADGDGQYQVTVPATGPRKLYRLTALVPHF